VNLAKAQNSIVSTGQHDKVSDRIAHLPEVMAADAQCKKLSKGKRHLVTFVANDPTPGNNFFFVKVAEDNGSNFHSWMLFNVASNTFKIFYYDAISGNNIPLRQWRQHRELYL
jgi:hypothetical protein